MEDKRTWECVKKPFQAIVPWDSTSKGNFLFGFGFIPSSSLLLPQLLRGENDSNQSDEFQVKPSKHAWEFSETVQKFSLLTSAKFAVNVKRVTLQHNKEFIVFIFYLIVL